MVIWGHILVILETFLHFYIFSLFMFTFFSPFSVKKNFFHIFYFLLNFPCPAPEAPTDIPFLSVASTLFIYQFEILRLKGVVEILNATINTNSEDIVDNSVDITKLKIQQGHMADTVSNQGVQVSINSRTAFCHCPFKLQVLYWITKGCLD